VGSDGKNAASTKMQEIDGKRKEVERITYSLVYYVYRAGQGEGCYRNVADYERILSGI
jgi:hypothetical protein